MSSGTRAVSVVLAGITHHGWQGRELQKSHLFVCYVSSLNGKHRGNSSAETKIQRHNADRLVVHGANWVRSNDCQRGATSEKSICRKTRSVFRGRNFDRTKSQNRSAYARGSRPEKSVRRNSPQLSAYADCGVFC